MGGGGETTRGAILNMWYLLLRHPDQFAAVRADDALWDPAFHETLRHSTPIGGQPRHNTFDVEIHGVKIPAGSLVNMVDFSANHDERIFADPEKFDIFRKDLYSGKLLRSGYRNEGKLQPHGVRRRPAPVPRRVDLAPGSGGRLAASCSKYLKNPRINVERMPKDIDGNSLAPMGLISVSELWLDYDLEG